MSIALSHHVHTPHSVNSQPPISLSLPPLTPSPPRKVKSPFLAAAQLLKPIHNQLSLQQTQPSVPSPRQIVNISRVESQHSAAAVRDSNDVKNTPQASLSTEDCNSDRSKHANDSAQIELELLKTCVTHIRPSRDAGHARPLICQDTMNSNADTLYFSRLPQGCAYDCLLCMVSPFGKPLCELHPTIMYV